MKKILLCMFATLAFSANVFARHFYVKPEQTGAGDATSWADANKFSWMGTPAAGDTVFFAEGVYNIVISIVDGVTYLGGYDPETGERDIEKHATILDGTDLGSFVLVKYDKPCVNPTTIEGFTLQNTAHSSSGGAAYLRANVILSKCTVKNCFTASSGGGIYNDGGTIKDCIIEFCTSTGAGSGIYQTSGLVENSIIRGNTGDLAAVAVYGGTIRNSVIYNNTFEGGTWPYTAGIYNKGTVANCIIACNYSAAGYSAIHSVSKVFNTVTWNNQASDTFADPTTFVANGSGSLNNASDYGFEDNADDALTLNKNNTAADGPQFKAPTNFAGAPKTAADTAAVRAADFSFLKTSPCIDKGITNENIPAYDINGVARPKGTAVDLGAYEYDPNQVEIPVTSIAFTQTELTIEEEQSATLTVIFTPENATDKTVTWTSTNPAIATVSAGAVTGVSVGTTTITAKHGALTATCTVTVKEKTIVIIHPDVLAADELKAENYAIPSYIPMLAAKEAARADSSVVNLKALKDAIAALQPKETPHSVVANINGDPTTRMAFAWYTGAGVTGGKVQLVKKANAVAADFATPTLELNATAKEAKNMRYGVGTSGILKKTGLSLTSTFDYTSHKAIATTLTPNTTYSYRVGTAGHWSDIKTFTTAAAGKESFSFLYMTDSHIQDSTYVEEARWAAITAAKQAPNAKFLLFTGDFVETGTDANSEWEWEQWFNVSMREALDIFPVAPTDGNHDDSPNLNYTYHFNTDNAFYQAAKVKPQFEGITYSFVYGDALFLIYSHQDYWRGDYDYAAGTSTYLTNDVANWFRQEVAAHPNVKWRIAAVHKNLFTGSGHQEDEDGVLFRSTLLPVFDELDMDLIIQGHDHTYEVMGPIDNLTKTLVPGSVSDVKTVEVNTNTNRKGLEGGTFNVTDGTMYFVNGTCGHKRYYPLSKEEMEANIDLHKVENYWDLFTGRFGQPGAPSFSHITVSTDQIEVKTYTGDKDANATLFDAWKIVKPTQETAVEDVTIEETNVRKVFENGQLIIIRDNVRYNVLGTQL